MIAPTITQRRVTLGIAGAPIPKHWEETIAACLAKQRERRPRSAAEVARRLRLGGTIRLTTAREIAKPVFQHYIKLGALAGGAIALLGAAVILSRSNSPVPRTSILSGLKKETAPSYALEQPVKALLMAAGVGVLLGVLWKRS